MLRSLLLLLLLVRVLVRVLLLLHRHLHVHRSFVHTFVHIPTCTFPPPGLESRSILNHGPFSTAHGYLYSKVNKRGDRYRYMTPSLTGLLGHGLGHGAAQGREGRPTVTSSRLEAIKVQVTVCRQHRPFGAPFRTNGPLHHHGTLLTTLSGAVNGAVDGAVDRAVDGVDGARAEAMMARWLTNKTRFCVSDTFDTTNDPSCYWGLPSIAADDPAFPPLGYWRGFVWGA